MQIVFPYSNQIASLERIEFKQGGAVKYGDPVLVPEHPWENVLAYLYGSVVKTTIYRMWYQAGGIYVAYARSHDGFLWEKPLLNAFTIEQPAVGPTVDSSDGGELCSSAARPLRVKSNVLLDLHMPSMIYDPPIARGRLNYSVSPIAGIAWRLPKTVFTLNRLLRIRCCRCLNFPPRTIARLGSATSRRFSKIRAPGNMSLT